MKYDTSDFREHLTNVTQSGKRVWIYPKIIKGKLYKYRTWFSWGLLAFLFTMPWIHVNGHPFFLLNVLERRFVIFGVPFWPQDFFLFALGLLTFVVFIVLFTAIFGRVWCGWACPQTVFMEMVFRKIENWIEGNSVQQKKLDESPWNFEKIWKKTLKHFIFWIISFLIANTFLAYLIGSDELLKIATDPISEHVGGFAAIVIFTTVFYLVFARLREIVCIIICPYGRLQGVLLDPNSVVVAFDYQRGEPRGKRKREADQTNTGDCVDCGLCVDVCPTRIDIRNGTQLECVNCTACIDACDGVMDKISRPRGLIRFASENQIRNKVGFRFTPKVIGYTLFFVILLGVFTTLLALRKDLQTTVMRADNSTYISEGNGHIANIFNIKCMNKTFHDMDVTVQLEGITATAKLVQGKITVKAGEFKSSVLLVTMNQKDIKENSTPFKIRLYANGELIDTKQSKFLGPVFD